MKAVWNGAVVAESAATRVVEGNHYFPPESLNQRFFVDSATTSLCSWKGEAHYKTLVVDGARNEDAAWFYPEPKPAAEEIRGCFAFWRGVEVTG